VLTTSLQLLREVADRVTTRRLNDSTPCAQWSLPDPAAPPAASTLSR
jgi:hypothetical protein